MKSEEKDWTKLSSYIGLSPDEIVKAVKSNGHMLLLGNDKDADELNSAILKTFYGRNGKEAGIAAMCSALLLKKYGAARVAMYAVDAYGKIAEKLKNRDLSESIRNMGSLVYYADHGYNTEKMTWPMPYPYSETNQMAGMLCVLLKISMMQLIKNGTTTELIAAHGIDHFLNGRISFAKKMKKNKVK